MFEYTGGAACWRAIRDRNTNSESPKLAGQVKVRLNIWMFEFRWFEWRWMYHHKKRILFLNPWKNVDIYIGRNANSESPKIWISISNVWIFEQDQSVYDMIRVYYTHIPISSTLIYLLSFNRNWIGNVWICSNVWMFECLKTGGTNFAGQTSSVGQEEWYYNHYVDWACNQPIQNVSIKIDTYIHDMIWYVYTRI
jgi:hypothetical protein